MRRFGIAVLLLTFVALAGCSKKNPTQPTGMDTAAPGAALKGAASTGSARLAPGQPGYEQAYVNNTTVTINAIEVPGKAPAQAQADFYEVVYPPNWQALGIAPPQCDPCDHDGNGIDPQDFHDHVLDSQPGVVGYRAPWHVYVVAPAYNGDATHDAAIGALYKANLPMKSETAVLDFLGMRLPSGAPVAVKIDTDFYFLCAVVPTAATP